nr:hypothetical protein [Tanacetum cinerariifolium]
MNTETSTKFMQCFLRLAGFLEAAADRRGGGDNHRSNNNYSGNNNRNSSYGRDQRNMGHQSNRSANSSSQQSRGPSEGYSYPNAVVLINSLLNQHTISLLTTLSTSSSLSALAFDKAASRLPSLELIKNLVLVQLYVEKIMSRRTETGDGHIKLDLKLNLSPPKTRYESPNRSSPITISPTNSCVSLEIVQDEENVELRYSSSPETTSMMLAGCPRCLMYVMLAEEYPKCPKCKSTVLLDVVLDKPMKKMRN